LRTSTRLGGEAAGGVQRVRLRDDVLVLLVGGEVVDLVGHLTGGHLAVRRLDEAERVDAPEGRQRADQADVRAFRGLDRAHPAVVARVHVADLEAGALAGQTTRAERRQAALVGQARQRVGLVHELAQLGGPEELLDAGHDRADVDQGLRRDRLDVLGGHPLADDALHAGQAQPDLVLDELADGAQAPVAEVVDVVGLVARLSRRAASRRSRSSPGRRPRSGRPGRPAARAELLVDLVATDLGEVVALAVEEQVLEQRLRDSRVGGSPGRSLR
jgi:hypothetical protein